MKEFRTGSALELCLKGVLLVAAITLPISTIICNIALLAAFLVSLIIFIKNRKFTWSIALLPVSIFVFSVLSILYSENLKAAFHWLELGTSLLLIPITFGFAGSVITPALRDKLLVSFSFSCLALCMVSYFRIAIRSGRFLPMSGMNEYSYEDPFSRIAFEEITSIHPSYLSVYLLFSIVILICILKANDVVKGVLIVLTFAFLVIMSSKNQMAIFFLVISAVLWDYIKASPKIKILIVSGIILLAITAGFLNSQLRYRFKDEISKNLGERMILWSNGLEIISDNPLIGVGVGDTDDAMNKKLERTTNQHLINYNMHNQYLDYWLMLGIPGLLCLLVILLMPVFQKVNMPFMFLIVIMALSLLTESMLYRHKGLVFFLFFYGLFGVDYALRSEKKGPATQTNGASA